MAERNCLFVCLSQCRCWTAHAIHENTNKTHTPHKQRQNRNQKLDIHSEIMQTLCQLVKLAAVILTAKVLCKSICLSMCWHKLFRVFENRLLRSLIFDYMFLWAWCASALGCVIILSKWLIIIDFKTIDFKIQSKAERKKTQAICSKELSHKMWWIRTSVLCPDKHFIAADFPNKRNPFWRSEHGVCVYVFFVPYFFPHIFTSMVGWLRFD